MLENIDGAWLNTTFNFTLDTTKPSITLHNPADGNTSSSTSFNFNWTATDNIDSNLTCNLTINGVVNVSSINSLNATPTNYTISGFAEGVYHWNMTCWDDGVNVNTSATWTFTVDANPPTITNVTDNSPQGFGANVMINASVTDSVGLDKALIEITLPNSTILANASMTNITQEVWQYN